MTPRPVFDSHVWLWSYFTLMLSPAEQAEYLERQRLRRKLEDERFNRIVAAVLGWPAKEESK